MIDARGRVVDRDAFKADLEAELTAGWEVAGGEAAEQTQLARKRAEWATAIRRLLADTLGKAHANYFYKATPPPDPQRSPLRSLAVHMAYGSPEALRSQSFHNQRLAKLEKVIGQL